MGAHRGRSKPHTPRLRRVKIDQSTGSDSNFFTVKRRRFYAFSRKDRLTLFARA
jgi:hypothetical protein